MAKLTVTYRCGHTVDEVRYGGKYAQQLDHAKTARDCPDCFRAAQSAARQEAVADLPRVALSGSEKQVRWAEDIRAKTLQTLRDMSGRLSATEAPKMQIVLDTLTHQPEARWWIDRRDHTARQIALEVAKTQGVLA